MTKVNASSAELRVIQSGVATFFGRPLADAGALDGVRCAIAGIPWDEGNAGRNGANMGPRAFRDASSWFLGYDAQRDFDLWEALPAADVGDIPVVPPNAERTMRLIEDHVRAAAEAGVRWFGMDQIEEQGIEQSIALAIEYASDGVDGLYVSFDLDSVDASAFPGTGTPEPGGFSARETLKIARALGRASPIAIDLVEIAPIYDLSGISTRLACGVALEMLAGGCGR